MEKRYQSRREREKIKDLIFLKEDSNKDQPKSVGAELEPDEFFKSILNDIKLETYEKKILESKDKNQLSVFYGLKNEISELILKTKQLIKDIDNSNSKDVIDEKEEELDNLYKLINLKNDQLIYMVNLD